MGCRWGNWGFTESFDGNEWLWYSINTLRPRQNGRHSTDNIFKCIFLNENVWIPVKISLKFVTKGTINNIPSLVQIMAWRRSGDKPLSEPMMVGLPMHICVTRPQWVNTLRLKQNGGHFAKTVSNSFSWMKMFEFWLKFYLSLCLSVQMTTKHYWFRYRLGAEQVPSHYLNQWWPSLKTNICTTRSQHPNQCPLDRIDRLRMKQQFIP